MDADRDADVDGAEMQSGYAASESDASLPELMEAEPQPPAQQPMDYEAAAQPMDYEAAAQPMELEATAEPAEPMDAEEAPPVWEPMEGVLISGPPVDLYPDQVGSPLPLYHEVDGTPPPTYADEVAPGLAYAVSDAEHETDGVLMEHETDGALTEEEADGALTEEEADGALTEEEADGALTEEEADSALTEEEVEEYATSIQEAQDLIRASPELAGSVATELAELQELLGTNMQRIREWQANPRLRISADRGP
ncbi:hypothetical protein IWQ56_002235, partial [Coemansia nantahalensis]